MSPTTKILIVENEEMLAENLKIFFARSTPDVIISADVHCTIKTLESFIPDIVVFDFDLPDMVSIQTYTEMVHCYAPLASFVMIISQLTQDISKTANHAGINHVLCMPFSFAELHDMIDRCLTEAADDLTKCVLDEILATNHRHEERRTLPGRRNFDVLNIVEVAEAMAKGTLNMMNVTNHRRKERRILPGRRNFEVVGGQWA